MSAWFACCEELVPFSNQSLLSALLQMKLLALSMLVVQLQLLPAANDLVQLGLVQAQLLLI